jgi:hypothetical protein
MKTKIAVALALFVGFCTVAPSAHAETPSKPNKGDTIYEFGDDSLLGKDIAGNVPIIASRGKARRDILHRPRLNFVPEMLKSVENM